MLLSLAILLPPSRCCWSTITTALSRRLSPPSSAAVVKRLSMSTTSSAVSPDAGGGAIGVVQLRGTGDKAANFAQARGYILQARDQGALAVFLPECADYIGESVPDTVRMAETIDGATCSAYRQLARETGLWLSIGSLHLKQHESSSQDGSDSNGDHKQQQQQQQQQQEADTRISNTHVIISPQGDIAARYDKIHMFDVHVPTSGGPAFMESRYTRPGPEIGPVVSTAVGRIGLAVCYDMRFAEVAIGQRELGAEILTYPSAFTVPTGQAHWESLLRARAIESQCWLVASAQVGIHSPRRNTYGHSMIVDPWGKVCGELDGQCPGLLMGHIDLAYLARVRAGMPVMQHRRLDVYPSVTGGVELVAIPDSGRFPFGPHSIPSGHVFCLTRLSYAAVNLRPIRPGHVIVCPRRRAGSVARLADLTPAERADLLGLAELVSSRLRQQAGTESCSFSLQDGPLAGQTVPHVHFHVLPRQPGDFEPNDAVYEALEEKTTPGAPARPDRPPEEMADEAAKFRTLFYA